jgi:hypothetical protein
VLALLVAAHPAALEQRDAAGMLPVHYALARAAALGAASIALLEPDRRQRCGAEAARPSAPSITAVDARGSEVWLSLSPPASGGARMLWYEIETIPLVPACDGGASLPDDGPVRTVSAHRPAPRVTVGRLTEGAPYAFRARAVGVAGPGAWCRADAAGHPDVALATPRSVLDATRRRNARAVVVAGAAAATDELASKPPAARPTEEAVHSALGDGGDGGGLVIPRALGWWWRARDQHKTLEFEYEVRWRASWCYVCARVLSPLMQGLRMGRRCKQNLKARCE